MRTTPAEPASDRRGHDSAHEAPMLPRDNPRRHREPDDDNDEDDRKEEGVER